jgi:hypothetical protein
MTAFTHFAYFGTEADLMATASELGDFVTSLRHPDQEDNRWMLVAHRDVDLDTVESWSVYLRAVAERHGGQYDGREVGIDPGSGHIVPDQELA